MYFGLHELWPIDSIRRSVSIVQGYGAEHDSFGRLSAFPGKLEIPCPIQNGKLAVLLVLGQSNAGNHASHKSYSVIGDKVVNYFGGRCYLASSPLLGSTETGGEGWTMLGEMLVASGRYERVVLIPAAIGATTVRRWSKGGDLNSMLLNVVEQASLQYQVTHVLWHQGESDLFEKTTRSSYSRSFLDMVASLREAGLGAPVYVSIATHCSGDSTDVDDNPVAAAQRSLPDHSQRIFSGPDTDSVIHDRDRYDKCHFGKSGVMKFAAAWFESLRHHEDTTIAAKRSKE